MESTKGKKKVRTTKCQQDKLVEIMERNPEKAKGGGSNLAAFWKDVAFELNSMGPAVKDGAAWRRAWIEKKSLVKTKLSHNKKEAQKTGGGKPAFDRLNVLEERIAAITNVREITAMALSMSCIGIPKTSENLPDDIVQLAPSHHSPTTDQPDTSHHSPTTDQPDTSHSPTADQPDTSHHSPTTEPNQPGTSNQLEMIQDQEKRTKKNAASKLDEFQKKILEQNDVTNMHLNEISGTLKIFAEGTLGIYKEMLKHMENKN